jgi:hypothetical protein
MSSVTELSAPLFQLASRLCNRGRSVTIAHFQRLRAQSVNPTSSLVIGSDLACEIERKPFEPSC